MHRDHIELLIAELQDHFQKIKNPTIIDSTGKALKRLWNFVELNPVLSGIVNELALMPQSDAIGFWIDRNDGEELKADSYDGENPRFLYDSFKLATEIFSAAEDESLHAKHPSTNVTSPLNEPVQSAGNLCLKSLPQFSDSFATWIVTRIRNQHVIFGAVKRYKQRCEWFHRKALRENYEAETQLGEAVLVNSLYEYLHEQGVTFQVEPKLGNGRPDFILWLKPNNPVIADAKVIKRNNYKDKIRDGINQVVNYLNRNNTNFGYLLLYQIFDADLQWNDFDAIDSYPVAKTRGITIAIITINISAEGGKQPSTRKPDIAAITYEEVCS